MRTLPEVRQQRYGKSKRDISIEIGPLDSDRAVPMYSYERPASLFWQGVYDGLIARSMTHDQAMEWLQSKHARWILNSCGEELTELGRSTTNRYTAKNGTVIDGNLPPCVVAMGCWCAGHARGNPASDPCDTSEVAS